MAILGRVLFPTFSAATADRDLLVRGVRRALVTVMLVNIPAMLGLMATAEAAVVTLFGDVWRPSAGLLRVLCLVGLFAPLNAINTNVLLAQGHSQRYLRIEIVKKLAGVLLLLAASPFGLVAMAWGQVVAAGAGFFLSAYYTGRLLGYPATHQLHDIAPFGVVGIVMGLLVWLLGGMLGPPGARVLALQCAVGLVVYVTTCRAMKLEALNALAGLAADRWRRIKGPDHDRNGLMREHP
jgi:O-antigen/teichoic acid export membrane protein